MGATEEVEKRNDNHPVDSFEEVEKNTDRMNRHLPKGSSVWCARSTDPIVAVGTTAHKEQEKEEEEEEEDTVSKDTQVRPFVPAATEDVKKKLPKLPSFWCTSSMDPNVAVEATVHEEEEEAASIVAGMEEVEKRNDNRPVDPFEKVK